MIRCKGSTPHPSPHWPSLLSFSRAVLSVGSSPGNIGKQDFVMHLSLLRPTMIESGFSCLWISSELLVLTVSPLILTSAHASSPKGVWLSQAFWGPSPTLDAGFWMIIKHASVPLCGWQGHHAQHVKAHISISQGLCVLTSTTGHAGWES